MNPAGRAVGRAGPSRDHVMGLRRAQVDGCIPFPFFDRFRHCLQEVRGYDLWAGDEPWRARMRAWCAACQERPSVQATSQSAEFYVNHYLNVGGYAGARGKSTMA